MKMTLEIDERRLLRVMKLAGIRTKTAAVDLALRMIMIVRTIPFHPHNGMRLGVAQVRLHWQGGGEERCWIQSAGDRASPPP